MEESWTKKCVYGNFIPDNYVLCDSCLLNKYGLLSKRRGDDYGEIYDEEDVVDALRRAEKGGYVKND